MKKFIADAGTDQRASISQGDLSNQMDRMTCPFNSSDSFSSYLGAHSVDPCTKYTWWQG